MANLFLLVREGLAAEAARLRAGATSLAAAAVLMLCAGAIAVIGLVFLLVGVYQSLVEVMAAWQAGAAVAVAVLAVAAALALLARARLRRRPPWRDRSDAAPADPAATQARRATDVGVAAGSALRRSGATPLDLVLAAFVAGLVTSRRSGRSARRDWRDSRRDDP